MEVTGLESGYGESHILWGADLSIQSGSVTTVMGRNGVGKSTLMKTIMGLVPVSGGSITFLGEDITQNSPHQKAKKGIGYVPQGREIIPKLSVWENLMLGLEARPDRRSGINEEEIYTLFPILKDFRKRLGGNLSGGQQQQLAIARILVGEPKLILFDEPTEGIQPSIIQEIGQVIKRLANEKDIAILLVEQKIDFAKEISDYYYFMDRGRMVLEGGKSEIDPNQARMHLAV